VVTIRNLSIAYLAVQTRVRRTLGRRPPSAGIYPLRKFERNPARFIEVDMGSQIIGEGYLKDGSVPMTATKATVGFNLGGW